MDKLEHWHYHSKAGINSWKNSDYNEHCKNLSDSMIAMYKTEYGKDVIRRQQETFDRRYEEDLEFKNKIDISRGKNKETKRLMKENDPELYKEKFCGRPSKSIEFKLDFPLHTFEIFKTVVDSMINEFPTNKKVTEVLSNNIEFNECIKTNNKMRKNWKFGEKTLRKMLKQYGYSGIKEYIEETCGTYFAINQYSDKIYTYNHKIKEIVKLNYTLDTGDIRISENYGHSNHNFLLAAGVFVHNSGAGPTVENLAGTAPGFTSFEDVDYYVNKVYKSLKIPISRRSPDQRMSVSNQVDIEKEELKFFKFVLKLRRRFNNLFVDLLKKDTLARKVMSLEDWMRIQEKIKFTYANSNEYSEIKNNQIIDMRMTAANNSIPLVDGGYLSKEWIQENIMRLTEDDVKKIDQDNAKRKQEHEDGEFSNDVDNSEFNNDYNISRRSSPPPRGGSFSSSKPAPEINNDEEVPNEPTGEIK